MNKLKSGDKFISTQNEVYTFLEEYPKNFDSDFVAKDKDGNLVNFLYSNVKKVLGSKE